MHLCAPTLQLTGSDVDGDALSFILTTLPTNGSLQQFDGAGIATIPTTVSNTDGTTLRFATLVHCRLYIYLFCSVLHYQPRSLSPRPHRLEIYVFSGLIRYTPPKDFVGVATFSYNVSDGDLTGEGTVEVTVRQVADIPVALPVTQGTAEDTNTVITLTGTDADGTCAQCVAGECCSYCV
jgi:Big-like domain-containing protein